jgi:DNA transformation protein
MADPRGDKLYVNLGASQARRRLKGFGHGVRKVQTAGKNQAVIIHTATERHLHELEQKFADVGYARSANDLFEPIENLKNIGRSGAARLRNAGIHTVADLQKIGPVAAFRLVRQAEPEVGLRFLWDLAAGLLDIDARELPAATKERLEEALRATR